MKLCTVLVVFVCVGTLRADNNGTASETSPKTFSPQFLDDDSRLFATPPTTVTIEMLGDETEGETTGNPVILTVERGLKRNLTEVKVLTKTSNATEMHGNVTGVLINDNKALTSKTNQNLNTNNTLVARNEQNLKELNSSAVETNINDTNNNANKTATNISVVYSKPYQAGKSLYPDKAVVVVYPDNKTELVNGDEIEILKINKANTTARIGAKKDEPTNKTVDNRSGTVSNATPIEVMTKERMKQIRHILYKRRPTMHYLLKVKTNEKSIVNKDDGMGVTADLYPEGTETIFTKLKPIEVDNFEKLHNDTTAETVTKPRKRLQFLSQNTEQTTELKTEITTTEQNVETTSQPNVHLTHNFKTDKEHSSTTPGSDVVSQRDYNESTPLNKTENTTDKPFRPSPEFNPNELPRYHMNMLRGRSTLLNIPIVHPLKRVLETTNDSKPKTTRSIMESMVQMLTNLRRLPRRQQPLHKRIDEDEAPSHNNNHNVEHLVENYESKKIKSVAESNGALHTNVQNFQPRHAGERKSGAGSAPERNNMSSVDRNSFRKQTRRPAQLRPRNRPPVRVVPTPNINNVKPQTIVKSANTDLHKQAFDNNLTLEKLSNLEQILKSNVLMDLERIRALYQNRTFSTHNTILSPTQNGEIGNTQSDPKMMIKQPNKDSNLRFPSTQYREENVNTLPPPTGSKRVKYFKSRTRAKPSREETPNRQLDNDLRQNVQRTRHRLRYHEVNSDENKGVQKNEPQKLNKRPRLRYHEIKPEDNPEELIQSSTKRNKSKNASPNTRPRLRYHEIKPDDKLDVEESRQQSTIHNNTESSETSFAQKINLRRKTRIGMKKPKEEQSRNNETKITSKSFNQTKIEHQNDTVFDDNNGNTTTNNEVKVLIKSDDKKIESNFNNHEFELSASGSENNETKIGDQESRNRTLDSNLDTHSNDSVVDGTKKDDLETLQSERSEKSIYNGQFAVPNEFEGGFLPMIVDTAPSIVALKPIGLKILRQSDDRKSPLQLPESRDQVQQFDIASPNLLTFYNRFGRVSNSVNSKGVGEDDEGDKTLQNIEKNTKMKEEPNGEKESHYDIALKQYNEALKVYNNYLEQFIQNKQSI